MKNMINVWDKYKFLLKQLIIRDFKIKYKRSILGITWSLLNPLLTMLVMALVFSQIFKFSVPGVNYLVYLFIGLIYFQYFNEASNTAMGGITNNVNLISKLYIPKYIFPLSKTIFVGINFLLTLIPLFFIILISGNVEDGTKCYLNIYYLLLPISFLFLFFFTTGVGLILCTINVFFRDMVYIYGILSTLWMYMTPIMYSLNIIPESLTIIFKLNPLYWIIDFPREIILYNSMPSATSWLACTLCSLVTFIIGVILFRKNQNKFIYHV